MRRGHEKTASQGKKRYAGNVGPKAAVLYSSFVFAMAVFIQDVAQITARPM
jgi:hypothetical protein